MFEESPANKLLFQQHNVEAFNDRMIIENAKWALHNNQNVKSSGSLRMNNQEARFISQKALLCVYRPYPGSSAS